MKTIKKYGIILLSTVVLCLQSCLKVDEEKFFSVYTGEALVSEKGVTLTARINKEVLEQHGECGFSISIYDPNDCYYHYHSFGYHYAEKINGDYITISLPLFWEYEDGHIVDLRGKTLRFSPFLNNWEEEGRIKEIEIPNYKTPDYADLGLSVKWATYDIGAEKIEEDGLLFRWGETTGVETDYSDYYDWDWSNYKWCYGGQWSLAKYCTDESYGYYYDFIDNITTLEAEDDAASVLWGDEWRMPTKEEFQELIDKCSWTYVDILTPARDYVLLSAYKVESDNGNFIFLGCNDYWSSSLYEEIPYQAYCFYSTNGRKRDRCERCLIRAVRED